MDKLKTKTDLIRANIGILANRLLRAEPYGKQRRETLQQLKVCRAELQELEAIIRLAG